MRQAFIMLLLIVALSACKSDAPEQIEEQKQRKELLPSQQSLEDVNRTSYAEIPVAGLNIRLKQYLSASKRQDYDAIFDMMYPEVYNSASRLQMEKSAKHIKESGIIYSMDNAVIKSISQPMTHQGKEYALIKYDAKYSYGVDPSIADSKETFARMLKSLKGSLNSNDIRVLPSGDKVEVKSRQELMAISNEGKQQWTFLNLDGLKGRTNNGIVPAEVLQHFGH